MKISLSRVVPALCVGSCAAIAVFAACSNGDSETAVIPRPSPSGTQRGGLDSGAATPTATVAATATSTPNQPSGLSQSFATSCAGCHGATGEGRGQNPALAGTSLTEEQFFSILLSGRGRMPSFEENGLLALNAVELQSDYAFLISQRASPSPTRTATVEPTVTAAPSVEPTVTAAPTATPTAPATVNPTSEPTVLPSPTVPPTIAAPGSLSAAFASRCAGCHGAEGEGDFGPRLQATGLTQAAYDAIVREGKSPMPKFNASKISDADLANDYAFFKNR